MQTLYFQAGFHAMQRAGGSPSTGTQAAGVCRLVGQGAAAVPGWQWQWEGALGVPGGCYHAYSKFWMKDGEVLWLTFQSAYNGSWKRERFWRNTGVWPPICPAACKLSTFVRNCKIWSSAWGGAPQGRAEVLLVLTHTTLADGACSSTDMRVI